jgi:hypothetical protein
MQTIEQHRLLIALRTECHANPSAEFLARDNALSGAGHNPGRK